MNKPVVNTSLEILKVKNAEKLFYRYLMREETGLCLQKISPQNGLYFDLFYEKDGKAALFKFMDTNADTFEILGDEIIEVMQEEKQLVDEYLLSKVGIQVKYYFIMPFVDFEHFKIQANEIIDKNQFEALINGGKSIDVLLSSCQNKENELIFELGKEYMVYNHYVNHGSWSMGVGYRGNQIKAILMEAAQIERINHLSYGSTLLEGATGTGKTSILFSKMIKLARLHPNEKFLFLTFDKQNSQELKKLLNYFHEDITNVRIINFHQFILKLGAKHNLRLNKNSKQNFNTEFKKVFTKVEKIYKGKRYYRGVFVDEAENFNTAYIHFLRNLCPREKSFFAVSLDEAKQLSPIDPEGQKEIKKNWTYTIQTEENYRQPQRIGHYNRNFQNNINTFSLLELDRIKDYFSPFDIARQEKGKLEIIEYDETEEAMAWILKIIGFYEEKNYEYNDIGILYPFNTKMMKGGMVDSKKTLKDTLDSKKIPLTYATDETNNFQKSDKIMLSNIYNFNNLEKRVIIFCQLDTIYDVNMDSSTNEIQRMLNIIYTGVSRATEALYILIKKDDQRPAIIDLLIQK